MKTTISQLAALTLFAFLLLAGNVNAKGTELNASSHESIETTLELEDWMIDSKLWDSTSNLNLELEIEEALVLENWMTSDNTWERKNRIETKTEKEDMLAFEPWMINENIWNR